jgi:hypothetical protein
MTLAGWGTAAWILLCVYMFVALLVVVVISYFMVRGMLWLNRKSKYVGELLLGYFHQGHGYVDQGMGYVAKPVIVAGATGARLRGVIAGIRKELPHGGAVRE